jgi:2-keto-4-pentenoate hydratase/2-oxohepta-3-ene-1,7-dioic acid hydratase in catechol pathway
MFSLTRKESAMIELPVLGGGSYRVQPSKIVAVGLNYRAHVAESPSILAARASGRIDPASAPPPPPSVPILFVKTPNVLVGPEEPIVIPTAFLHESGIASPRTDYEAELAVVIGKRCRNVAASEALSCVLGYSCFNDVSQREVQNGDRSGWWRGKSFDSFGPIGPVLVPASRLPDPQALPIKGRLNGSLVQEATTADMIFTVAELIAYISRNVTLEEGDIIATGTPSGVGALKAGDRFEVEIGGIGVLGNPVIEE